MSRRVTADPSTIRVLIVDPAGNLWGSERILLDFVDRMPNTEVAVCCPPQTPLIAELKKLSVRIFPYFVYGSHQKNRLMRLWAAIGTIRACLRFRPHVIYLNQGGCYRVVLPAAVLFDLPVVAHVQIYEDVDYFCERRPNPRRLRGFVALSLSIADRIGSCPALADIPRHLLYHCYIRRNVAQPAERIANRIACVGRLVPAKGQDVLIEAMHSLARAGIRIECLMVGDGPADHVDALKAAAAAGEAAECIQWLGFRNDVLPLLATCAVEICPSHYEPMGRVILEAWDAGAVPVACKQSGGAAEIIAAADGGILYDEQSPQSLREALLAALQLAPDKAGKIVANGRSWMAQHCDPATYAVAISAIFREAVATHGKNDVLHSP